MGRSRGSQPQGPLQKHSFISIPVNLGLAIQDKVKLFQVMLEDENRFVGIKISDTVHASFFMTIF